MAGKKSFMNHAGDAPAFHMPYNAGGWNVGQQIFALGESHIDYGLNTFQLQPTPTPVPVLSVLASFAGQAMSRALPQDNNSIAEGGLENYLYLGGVIQKSRG